MNPNGEEIWTNYGIASAPLQAYLFAALLSLFQLRGEYLRDLTDFWCLMTVMLAVLVGLSYFAMGWSATTLAFVSYLRS